jgi:hypothetical protein
MRRTFGLVSFKTRWRRTLAENEERWRQDPLALIHMPELFLPQPDDPGAEVSALRRK